MHLILKNRVPVIAGAFQLPVPGSNLGRVSLEHTCLLSDYSSILRATCRELGSAVIESGYG